MSPGTAFHFFHRHTPSESSGTALALLIAILFAVVGFGCAIFAVSDEFHQSFVSSRTASGNDVLIDISGALIGLAICIVVAGRKVVREKHA